MARVTVESVPIELADGEHALRFDNRALKRVEADFGCSFSKVGELLQSGEFSVTQIEQLIVAGLAHEARKIDDADAMFDGVSIRYQVERVAAALVAAFGQSDDEATGKNPTGPTATTGEKVSQ